MVLCGGHGPFAWGKDADKAVYNGTVLEEICKMALNTKILNPNLLISSSFPVFHLFY